MWSFNYILIHFPAMMIEQVNFLITCILVFQTKTVITIYFFTPSTAYFHMRETCACVFIKKQIPFYFVKKIKILEFETFFYSFQFHLNNEKVDNYTCICNLKWQHLQMHAYALVPSVWFIYCQLPHLKIGLSKMEVVLQRRPSL